MYERTVRRDLIDPALTKAGWDVTVPPRTVSRFA